MGKQARLRRERREMRALSGPPGEPLRILRGIHRTIQGHCSENGRRCWEYMLEMLAQATGWETESNEAQHLWDKMANEERWLEFIECWIEEVKRAKENGAPFSEPIGQLLEEVGGANSNLGQFFTPMPVVRTINAMTLHDIDNDARGPGGMPTHRGLDPCCGSGRFIIDALVHNDNLMMHGVDLDLWAMRAAMLNVRLLAPWTSLRLVDPDDRLKPLRRANKLTRMMLNPFEEEHARQKVESAIAEADAEGEGGILLIGGRAIFMHGDALVCDLDYTPNWLCAGWAWKPHPWTWNLKMRGYYGSYDDWRKAGCPDLSEIAEKQKSEIQFDYSMRPQAAAG